MADKTDQLIQDFIESTDAATQIEKELNDFAAEITPVLIKMNTAIKAYRDAVYSINLENKHPYYTIRLGNVTEYRNTMGTPYENQMRVLRADFEFEENHTLEEQVKTVVTALLFRVYGLVMRPEETDEGTVQVKC
jgi:hypothetical protein